MISLRRTAPAQYGTSYLADRTWMPRAGRLLLARLRKYRFADGGAGRVRLSTDTKGPLSLFRAASSQHASLEMANRGN